MKTGDVVNIQYGRAQVEGKIVHREGMTVLVKVTKSSNHEVVKPGQSIPVSVPQKR